MSLAIASGYCRACQQNTRVSRQRPSHLLHLVLTILTVGLWGWVWLFVSMFGRPWRCDQCGRTATRRTDGATWIAVALLLVITGCAYLVWSRTVSRPVPSQPQAREIASVPAAARETSKEQIRSEQRRERYLGRVRRELDAGDLESADRYLKRCVAIQGIDQSEALSLQKRIRNADDLAWVLSRLKTLSESELHALDTGEGTAPKPLDLGYEVLTKRAVANARLQISSVLAERTNVKQRQAQKEEAAREKAELEAERRAKEERRQRAADAKRRKVEAARETAAKAEAARIAEEEYQSPSGLVLLRKTVQGTRNRFGGEVTGTVVNRTGKKFGYAQITFILYDASGAQVGTAIGNITDLEAGARWNFRASSLGMDFVTYKFSDLIAY